MIVNMKTHLILQYSDGNGDTKAFTQDMNSILGCSECDEYVLGFFQESKYFGQFVLE